jgi:putative toxin-antitoxin system antitoxin component (TIGR02293 family)
MAEIGNGTASEASRIAKFIGLPRWRNMDDISLVDKVRSGFPAGTAETIVTKIDPGGRFVRATDIIPKSTLHRRKEKQLTKDESERIWALARVFSEVLRIYHEDVDLAALFLMKKHPLLRDRSSIDVAKESIAGADLVMKLLANADAGVAA